MAAELPIPMRSLSEILSLEYGAPLPERMRTGTGFAVFGSSGEVGRHSTPLVHSAGIIVGRKGTAGAVTWSQSPFWPIDTTYYVRSLGPDLRWLYWALSRLPLTQLEASTGVPGLNRHDVYGLCIPVPSLSEQHRIAEILDALDEAIQRTDQLISKLKQIKQGLLHDLLTRGLDANGELRDLERHPELFKESPLGRIPATWSFNSLKDLCESAVDGPFGSNLKTEHYVAEPGVRVVRLQNIGEGEFLESDQAWVSTEHASALERHQVCGGDVLVASLGDENHPFGRACLFPADAPAGIVKADCFRLRVLRDRATPEFVAFSLNIPSRRGALRRLAQGVTRDRVNLGNLLRVEIPTAPIQEQILINQTMHAAEARITAEGGEVRKLRSLKQCLMEDLLTGKVPVTSLLREIVA